MSKLKIAVCFFGHLRSYEKCAPYLKKNFLKNYDCDLFMHTWSTIDHNTQTWHNFKETKGLTSYEKLLKVYGDFKGIKIEEQLPQDLGVVKIKRANSRKEQKMGLFGIKSVLYSMRQSLGECEKYISEYNVHYDYIFFIRPDIWFKNLLTIEDVLKNIPSQKLQEGFFTLACPMGGASDSDFTNMRAVDLCFFAKPHVINKVINNNELAIEGLKPNEIIDYSPELRLIWIVQKNGFIPFRIESFIELKDWEILRAQQAVRFYKKIIKFRLRKDKILLRILPYMMVSIVNIKVNLFKNFTIAISLGHNSDQIN